MLWTIGRYLEKDQWKIRSSFDAAKRAVPPGTRADIIGSSDVAHCIQGSVTWYGVFGDPRAALYANQLRIVVVIPADCMGDDSQVSP